MTDPILKRITALFVLILILLAAVTVVSIRTLGRSADSSDWVNHTHAVLSEAEALLSSIHAGEAALRNYILTGDERDRISCRRAYGEAAGHLELAKGLTRTESKSHADILNLEPLIARRVDFARNLINARQQQSPAALAPLLAADNDETLEIQLRLAAFKEAGEVVLRSRDQESYRQAQNTRWAVLTGSALNALVVLFLLYLLRDDMAARRRAASALTDANERLEATVTERTRSLAAAHEALILENLEQRWSNQALDHQMRYNELIINSIDGLVLVISKALNISRINPAVTRRTGFEASELVGTPLDQSLLAASSDEADREGTTRRILSCLKDGKDLINARAGLRIRKGDQVPVTFSVFPLRDRDRIVGGVVTIKLSEPSSG